jgi:dephospho-CoA kinase
MAHPGLKKMAMNESLKARKIGITGGIGSGKSTVRKLLTELGYCSADADFFVQQVVSKPEVKSQIVSLLGEAAYTPENDYHRKFVRDLVFDKPALKSQLENVLFPEVQKRFNGAFATLQEEFPGAWFFYEATLLIEAGRSHEFDAIVLVSAPAEKRSLRVQKRSGLSEESAEKIILNQSNDTVRRPFCQFEIVNDGDLTQLSVQVQSLLQDLRDHFCPSHS